MPCYFCDEGTPLLPGHTGREQYHAYRIDVGSFPQCAFEFRFSDEKHPFLPKVSGIGCDFCGLGPDEPVHQVRSK